MFVSDSARLRRDFKDEIYRVFHNEVRDISTNDAKKAVHDVNEWMTRREGGEFFQDGVLRSGTKLYIII